MDRPCHTAIVCPGPQPGLDFDSPITNYSSEYTDGPDFPGLAWPIFNPFDPGNPGWWSAVACGGLFECFSFLSQEDADACARRLADICSMTPPRLPPYSPPECLSNPSSCIPAHTLYYNTAQTCQTTCPEGGGLFYWTIPAGWFVATSQALADRLAAELACQMANQNKVCLSELRSQPCKDVYWATAITATGRGPFTFAVVDGALPPGINLAQTGSNQFQFRGICSIPGFYQVTVRATSFAGWIAARVYTIGVLGITNADPLPEGDVGSPYSVQLIADGGTPPYTFEVADGSLPDGLTLSSAGLISGTPTTDGTHDFTVRVTDSTP